MCCLYGKGLVRALPLEPSLNSAFISGSGPCLASLISQIVPPARRVDRLQNFEGRGRGESRSSIRLQTSSLVLSSTATTCSDVPRPFRAHATTKKNSQQPMRAHLYGGALVEKTALKQTPGKKNRAEAGPRSKMAGT